MTLSKLCCLFTILLQLIIPEAFAHFAKNESSTTKLEIPDSVWVAIDENLQYTPEQVSTLPLDSGKFHNKNLLSFDFFNSAIWIRFNLENNTEKALSRFLLFDNADIYAAELYLIDSLGLSTPQIAGKSIKVSERNSKRNSPTFALHFEPHSKLTVLLKVHKLGGAVVVPISIKTPAELDEYSRNESAHHFLMYGLQLFAVMFNLFLFVLLRHRIYIKYTLYVLFSILSIAGLSGYTNQYFWPEWTWLAERETVLFNFPGTMFLLYFVQEYLNLKRFMPRANKLIYYSQSVLAVGLLFAALSPVFVSVAVLLSNITTLYCFILATTICTISIKHDKIAASYVLVSYIPILISVISYFLRSAGVIANTNLLTGLDFAVTFQVLTLALAVVDRFRREEKNKLATIEATNLQLEKLTLATRETDNAIAIYSRFGDIEWCNKGFESTYGLNLNEIKDQFGNHITDICLNEKISEYYRKCNESGDSVIFETAYKDNSNIKHWQQTTLTPITDEKGVICNYITVDADLTESKLHENERQKLQEQLLQSQKMETVGKLAGGIAHDFNNILTPIIGYTDMAMSDLPKDSYIKDDLNRVLNAAQRAKKLVSQILTFSRHFKEEARPIAIGAIIDEVVELMKSSLPTNIAIQFDNRALRDKVFADPTQIQQVLMNLCTNAHQTIGTNHGKITISIENTVLSPSNKSSQLNRLNSGEYIHLQVKDTGQGMSEETLSKLFDPFFTTKEVGKGTGLGLSVVHGIVIKYQGEVYFESELGKGSIAHVYFPYYNGADHLKSSTESNQMEQKILGADQKIIVVDDEENISNMLGKVLTKSGFSPHCFTDSNKALFEYAKAPQDVDLIIADQTMPEKTGIELAREIRKINPKAKIIILTGYSEALDADSAEKEGIEAVLYKPVNIQILLNKIHDILKLN